jgi:hypothetical protein
MINGQNLNIGNAKKQKKAPNLAAWGLIHLFRGWRRQSRLSIK